MNARPALASATAEFRANEVGASLNYNGTGPPRKILEVRPD